MGNFVVNFLYFFRLLQVILRYYGIALNTQHRKIHMASNPVLNSEFKYQRFVIQRSRSGGFWIFLALLMVAPSLLLSLGYCIGLLLNLFPLIEWHIIPSTWHLNLLLMLIVVNVSMYIVVTLVTIGLANGSINREKDKHTWSLLRLTNISNTQIVLGKWWASLRALNGDHAMVILLRVGLLAIALAIFIPSQHAIEGITAPYRLYFLAILPLIVLQGFLDAALSAILGIAGAIPDDAWRSVGNFTVMIVRLFLGMLVAWWFWMVIMLIGTNFTAAIYLTLAGILMTAILIAIAVFIAQFLLDL